MLEVSPLAGSLRFRYNGERRNGILHSHGGVTQSHLHATAYGDQRTDNMAYW